MISLDAWKQPKLQWIRAGMWRVIEGYRYITDEGVVVDIPEGYETDLVSSPRILWAFIPSTGEAAPGGLVHDFLYSTKPPELSRRDCDRILWEACNRLGVDRWVNDLIYDAVRIGGGSHW